MPVFYQYLREKGEKDMKKIILVLTLFLFAGSLTAAVAAEVPRMSKEELKAAMGSGEIVIMDARSGKDWKSSEFKIKGAIRTAIDSIDEWLPGITKENKSKKLVIYCA
jgi:predicted sulfurtransferase